MVLSSNINKTDEMVSPSDIVRWEMVSVRIDQCDLMHLMLIHDSITC